MSIQSLELELVETRIETPDVKSFVFSLGDYKFDYKPGQSIRVTLEIENCDEKCNRRPFSLASSPTESFLMISTKISQTAFKTTLDSLKKGTKVSISGPGPAGEFALPEDYSKNLVMLGGGIGITPFRNMIRFATDKRLPTKITLIYSNKVPADIAFRREFEECESRNANLKIVNTITRPQESEEKWTGLVGRIDAEMIRKQIADWNNSIFYTCGPPAMADTIVTLLQEMKISRDNIKVEKFMGY